MYVEDLVLRLACEGKYIFEPAIIQGNGWESNFAISLASQIQRGNALTEKQATLALKILKKHQASLEVYFQRTLDLDNPIYQNPFRKISEEKTINVEKHQGKDYIAVRFAYDAEIIKLIQTYVNEGTWKSLIYRNTLKHEIAEWNHEIKAWMFRLKEENILWLGNNILNKGFRADETFITYLEEIKNVLDNMYEHAPYIIKDNEKFNFKNVSEKIKPIDSSNVLEFLFYAKTLGITAWNDDVDQDLKNINCNDVTQILLNSTNPIFVDSNVYDISNLKDLVIYGGPTMVIIPGGSEIEHTMKWHQTAKDWGIASSDMSVMFRMPNETGGAFNKYIKENLLNNEVHENTKIVFVSTKIPKPLIKSGLKFNNILNLGYYRDLHFSMSVVLQSTPNIVYYNNKQPHGVNVCPQQN